MGEQTNVDLPVFDGHVHLTGKYHDVDKIKQTFRNYNITQAIMFAFPVTGSGARYVPAWYITMTSVTSWGRKLTRALAGQARKAAVLKPNNNDVLHLMSLLPKRIHGYAFINPALHDAETELRRCLDAGMIGIKLHLYFFPMSLLDQRLAPILQIADERRLPVLIDLGLQENAEREIVMIAHRYPNAIFIIPHLNPIEIIDAAEQARTIMLDISGFPVTLRRLQLAVKRLGPGRIIFGSDSPRESGGDVGYTLRIVEKLGLSTYDRSRIYFDNLNQIVRRQMPQ